MPGREFSLSVHRPPSLIYLDNKGSQFFLSSFILFVILCSKLDLGGGNCDNGSDDSDDESGDADNHRPSLTAAEQAQAEVDCGKVVLLWETLFSCLRLLVAVANGSYASELARNQTAVYALCLILWYVAEYMAILRAQRYQY
jgi:hypothetical protein